MTDSAAAPVEVLNERGAFLRLLIKGAALQLVTFGFYRFWLTTDIRRHLWSHTRLEGDPFEYLGRAKELLIGFLIALAILVPIYLVYFLIGLEAERLRAFASIPLFFAMYVFGHFAVYRARRYRLSRTVWRGVRFQVDGSGFAYAGRVLLWSPLILLSLGLAYPWRAASLERYKMSHTQFGDQRGAFTGTGGQLFKRMWWLILLGLLAIACYVGIVVLAALTRRGGFSDPLAIALGLLSVLSLLALPFLLPVYRAIEWRWWADGVEVGAARLACRLPNGALLKLYLKAIFVGLLVLAGLGLVVGAIGGAIYYSALSTLGPGGWEGFLRGPSAPLQYAPIVVVLVVYLAFGLTIGVVQKLYLQHDYWRVVASSVTIAGLGGLAAAAASGAQPTAVGEGLADSLDVAAF